MAYAYTDFLQPAGPVQSLLRELTGLAYHDYWFPEIRSLGGAVAMLVLVLYPYAYMLSRAAFLDQSVCALDVSRTLGCAPWASFFRVALPLTRPANIAGPALELMDTLADFGRKRVGPVNRVSVRLNLGDRRVIQKKQKTN